MAACGPANNGGQTTADAAPNTADGAELSGQIAGAGASSQENAALAWIAGFTERTDVTVTYDPTGSGTGREQFLNGTVEFAGSDSALDEDERAAATERCFGSEALELPLYISPIAVVQPHPTPSTQPEGETIAKIFAGEITNWNDPEIAEANPGVELPTEIIPVNRHKSGTTGNFTEYLAPSPPRCGPTAASKNGRSPAPSRAGKPPG